MDYVDRHVANRRIWHRYYVLLSRVGVKSNDQSDTVGKYKYRSHTEIAKPKSTLATSTINRNGIIVSQIFRQSCTNISSSGTAFSVNWQDFDLFILTSQQYSNVFTTTVITSDYLASTTSGKLGFVYDPFFAINYGVRQNGSGSIIVQTSKTTEPNLYLAIWGIKF